MNIEKFEQIRASGELPSPRGVALAVVRLIRQDEVSMADLARVISGDPAFAGRIIKAANGLIALNRRPVVSVQEALLVLGLPAVRAMALGFSLISDYRKGGCRAFDYSGFWGYSLALALGMQAFSQRTRAAAPDEMFSLGLLLRVGELALATLYPEQYANVLETGREGSAASIEEREREAFAMTHAELGGAMLTDWGLPGIFVELVPFFDRPDLSDYVPGSRQRNLLDTLLTAGRFADICLAEEARRPLLLERLLSQALQLGLEADAVIADCMRMYALWGEWGGLLQLEIPSGLSFPARLEEHEADVEQEAHALRSAFVGNEEPESVASQAGEEHPCVLLIESAAELRSRLSEFVHALGGDAVVARDGVDALEQVLLLHPRMVVVGSSLSAASMLELVGALRELRLGKPMYLLCLIDGDTEERLVALFDAGADDVVSQAAGPRVLSARLKAGLREARLQMDLEHEREELRRYAAELAVKNRQLQEVALTDMLTGFRNRRYAINRIEQEWRAAEREGRALSCMVIDLDGLKEINDAYGHDIGDEALRSVAEAMRGILRGQDVICRTGGDEFLAICPGATLDAALIGAERLRVAVAGVLVRTERRSVPVSVSIGVATRTRETGDVDAMMRLADQGAYMAKHSGRNQVAAVQRKV